MFQATRHAYLPEIDAYLSYLAAHHPEVVACDSRRNIPEGFNPDVVWRFMGMDREKPKNGKYIVHDYNSLSTGVLARQKNFIKRFFNVKPQRRVFLSEPVKAGFPFKDDVPYSIRDMGIDPAFFVERDALPAYDFIYVGSLDRGRTIIRFLDYFSAQMLGYTLLLVGHADENLIKRYGKSGNIVFTGRVPYADVPGYLAKARYGLNLMPDRYPFNVQTSTKLLEYCAAGLGIVSSDYHWARQFEKERSANFLWLSPGFKNLTHAHLENFAFGTPEVQDLTWENVIKNSGIFSFLKSGER